MIRQTTVLVTIIGLAACRASEGREQIDFERMRQQQRYDLFEQSHVFRNGAVMQAPPPNTVPRTAIAGDTAVAMAAGFFTGASNGADVATIPIPDDSATRSSGAKQFAISCAPCHGVGGFGGGIMAPNLDKQPPSLRVPPVSALAAGTIFKVITEGFGMMPPYGWQMPPDARWAVVSYVRELPRTPMTAAMRDDSIMADSLARRSP